MLFGCVFGRTGGGGAGVAGACAAVAVTVLGVDVGRRPRRVLLAAAAVLGLTLIEVRRAPQLAVVMVGVEVGLVVVIGVVVGLLAGLLWIGVLLVLHHGDGRVGPFLLLGFGRPRLRRRPNEAARLQGRGLVQGLVQGLGLGLVVVVMRLRLVLQALVVLGLVVLRLGLVHGLGLKLAVQVLGLVLRRALVQMRGLELLVLVWVVPGRLVLLVVHKPGRLLVGALVVALLVVHLRWRWRKPLLVRVRVLMRLRLLLVDLAAAAAAAGDGGGAAHRHSSRACAEQEHARGLLDSVAARRVSQRPPLQLVELAGGWRAVGQQ